MTTRGFIGRRPRPEISQRLPPGQHETTEFPVLSIGPTPLVKMEAWSLSISSDGEILKSWTWTDFHEIEPEEWVRDIHCVTRWSKFDTRWRGVSMSRLLRMAGLQDVPPYLSAVSIDGYSSNVLAADVVAGRAMVATHFDGLPLTRHHGGPARLLIPHLYLWKSAKWLTELNFSNDQKPGFWEARGYHNTGDPWREQRFDGE